MISSLKRFFGIKRSIPYELVLWWIKRRCRDEVISGPFQGAKCIDAHIGCQYCPRVLGIYESELQPTIRRLLDIPFREVLDIGAAEGYYAVGFALKSRAQRIVAYESEASGQAFLKEVVALNGVSDKVAIKGECDAAVLAADLNGSEGERLIIVDIEGGEKRLLDPEKIPALREAHVLVELHDQFDPSISTTLRDRFEATHRREHIFSVSRRISDLPVKTPWWMRTVLKKWLLMATQDGRGIPMSWYYLQPKDKTSDVV